MQIRNPWVAYQLDAAVIMVGGAIEGALMESIKVGSDDAPRYESKYTLTQLLDPAFRLPVDDEEMPPDLGRLKGLHGVIVD